MPEALIVSDFQIQFSLKIQEQKETWKQLHLNQLLD